MPANSGESKAMIDLATSFVYRLLMGGCRGMKLLYKQLYKSRYCWFLCGVICKKNDSPDKTGLLSE